MMPEIGKHYRKNGFEFRVDFIENGEIYVVRWPLPIPEDRIGVAIRVPFSVWEEQMAGAAG